MPTIRRSSPKRGRPALPAAQRKGGNITFRVRDRLQRRISEEALKAQRSMSEEVERSLEDHYANRDAYGELACLLGAAVKAVEQQTGKRYSDDRNTRIQTRAALGRILDVMVWPHIDTESRRAQAEEALQKASDRNSNIDLAAVAADLADLRTAFEGERTGVTAALGADFPLAAALRRQAELQAGEDVEPASKSARKKA